MTPSGLPLLSVVIPTHRRPAQLARCLAALAEQDYPPDRFAVVVVDDGSPEPPSAVIAAARERLSVDLIRQPRAGPATARNAGARQARGELLVFTDDDCAPEPGWLRALADAHAETPDAALGGWTRNALDANPFSTASQLLIDYLYGYFNADPDAARLLTSNNLAVPAGGFREIGGFETGFPLAAGEDRELCDRWVADGRTIRLVAAARVAHHHALTLRSFLRQHFGYGRGALQFQRARARRGARTRVEPPGFYVRLLLHPFTRMRAGPALAQSVLLSLAQGANAAGFFWERWRGGARPGHKASPAGETQRSE